MMMTVVKEKLNGNGDHKVEVPTWVMAATYIMCWLFAAALAFAMITGRVEHQGIIIGTVIYLITWPMFQINPAEMIRRVFPAP